MDIQIVSASGTGSTSLASFDSALQNAGVSNYNLIALSSVIPPHSKILPIERYQTPEEDFGKRLYVVKAEQKSDGAGQSIGAGIGWYQLQDGRGFFVEHEVSGESESAVNEELKWLINHTLEDMCEFREIQFDPNMLRSKIITRRSVEKYECVLVLAVYMAELWIK